MTTSGGACVIRYAGKRGVVFRIKYRDADGRQVKETLGRADEGWDRKRAKAALRARLVAVEREHYRKPEPVSFESFAREWLDTVPEAKQHRRTTKADYRGQVENHLIPSFCRKRLAEITTADIDHYVAAKQRAKPPLGPRTLNNHLTRLHSIFESARKRGLVQTNPVSDAERPRVPRSHWTILSSGEVALVLRALNELIAEAEDDVTRAWRQTARAMVMTFVYAWLRRGEALGLRWRDVELAHPDGPWLHVRQTIVRGHLGDPKTDEGSRTIALAEPLADELWAHWQRSHYRADDDLVFCHPTKGSPFVNGYFGGIVGEALNRAGIAKPMREFHDWRHTGITNAAAAGMSPMAIMRMAGHSNFATTQRYIDLAGVLFGDEVARLGDWYGRSGTKSGYQVAPVEEEVPAIRQVA